MGKYNIAAKMSTQQSTTARRRYSSRRAVDGVKKRGYCTQTSGKDVPWWQVELKAVYVIKEVDISGVCSSKSLFLKIVITKKHTRQLAFNVEAGVHSKYFGEI